MVHIIKATIHGKVILIGNQIPLVPVLIPWTRTVTYLGFFFFFLYVSVVKVQREQQKGFPFPQ